MNSSLYMQVRKLAAEKPEFKQHLIPLLRQAAKKKDKKETENKNNEDDEDRKNKFVYTKDDKLEIKLPKKSKKAHTEGDLDSLKKGLIESKKELAILQRKKQTLRDAWADQDFDALLELQIIQKPLWEILAQGANPYLRDVLLRKTEKKCEDLIKQWHHQATFYKNDIKNLLALITEMTNLGYS